MLIFLNVLLLITSLALMALILLHRGKGGGLSSLFGGSMQSSLSGSSVVEKNLDRLTLFVAAVWTVAIIGVGLLLKVGA
jgi:preprotein translocase subunit SecG